jgi:hypothetical protein
MNGWTWREMFPSDEPLIASVAMAVIGLFLLITSPIVILVHFSMKALGVKDGIFY